MNELTELNYTTDCPAVSVLELQNFLICCPNFESFFTTVCKLKVTLDRDGLVVLHKVVSKFYARYSHEAIAYLLDCITCEKVLPCNSKTPRNSTEKYYQKIIVESFESIFPDFLYVGNEIPVPPAGRIDILAKDKKTNRDVIIELKVDNKNPTQQLLAYATAYKNPILIGISTRKFLPKPHNNQVRYYTYEELGL